MKRITTYLIPSLMLIALSAAAFAVPGPAPDQAVDAQVGHDVAVQELTAWVERYCQTVTAGDFEGYRAFWTDDVIWLPPNTAPRVGIEACMEYNRPLFEYYHSVETMSAEEVKLMGSWAFLRVNYTYQGTPKAGTDVEPIKEDGKGVFLLQRKPDGSWVATHCVWNSNLPLEGDENRP
jgi:ketosteroid isomerase-like protein